MDFELELNESFEDDFDDFEICEEFTDFQRIKRQGIKKERNTNLKPLSKLREMKLENLLIRLGNEIRIANNHLMKVGSVNLKYHKLLKECFSTYYVIREKQKAAGLSELDIAAAFRTLRNPSGMLDGYKPELHSVFIGGVL